MTTTKQNEGKDKTRQNVSSVLSESSECHRIVSYRIVLLSTQFKQDGNIIIECVFFTIVTITLQSQSICVLTVLTMCTVPDIT
jgi:hypothetical protein